MQVSRQAAAWWERLCKETESPTGKLNDFEREFAARFTVDELRLKVRQAKQAAKWKEVVTDNYHGAVLFATFMTDRQPTVFQRTDIAKLITF
jgi:hypothetical protein